MTGFKLEHHHLVTCLYIRLLNLAFEKKSLAVFKYLKQQVSMKN